MVKSNASEDNVSLSSFDIDASTEMANPFGVSPLCVSNLKGMSKLAPAPRGFNS